LILSLRAYYAVYKFRRVLYRRVNKVLTPLIRIKPCLILAQILICRVISKRGLVVYETTPHDTQMGNQCGTV
jgi:hypothetical protein